MLWHHSIQLVKSALHQRIIQSTSVNLIRPLFTPHPWFGPCTSEHQLIPVLSGMPVPIAVGEDGLHDLVEEDNSDEDRNSSIWFAVPKKKISKSRKRMKTTSQKRLPLKKNIVFDPRTGEVTLKHHLPFNWKDYLPKESEEEQDHSDTNKLV